MLIFLRLTDNWLTNLSVGSSLLLLVGPYFRLKTADFESAVQFRVRQVVALIWVGLSLWEINLSLCYFLKSDLGTFVWGCVSVCVCVCVCVFVWKRECVGRAGGWVFCECWTVKQLSETMTVTKMDAPHRALSASQGTYCPKAWKCKHTQMHTHTHTCTLIMSLSSLLSHIPCNSVLHTPKMHLRRQPLKLCCVAVLLNWWLERMAALRLAKSENPNAVLACASWHRTRLSLT